MNSLPRWLISITDMPLPCQSSISAAAVRRTGSGSTAGPALKLKIRIVKALIVARLVGKATLSGADGRFHNSRLGRPLPAGGSLAFADARRIDYAAVNLERSRCR